MSEKNVLTHYVFGTLRINRPSLLALNLFHVLIYLMISTLSSVLRYVVYLIKYLAIFRVHIQGTLLHVQIIFLINIGSKEAMAVDEEDDGLMILCEF
jgi:hypothetical protein